MNISTMFKSSSQQKMKTVTAQLESVKDLVIGFRVMVLSTIGFKWKTKKLEILQANMMKIDRKPGPRVVTSTDLVTPA